MEYQIDPLVALLAVIGAADCMVVAVVGLRRLAAMAGRVRMWWRWRVVMARGYRREVAA
jgi:hypothetical protein